MSETAALVFTLAVALIALAMGMARLSSWRRSVTYLTITILAAWMLGIYLIRQSLAALNVEDVVYPPMDSHVPLLGAVTGWVLLFFGLGRLLRFLVDRWRVYRS